MKDIDYQALSRELDEIVTKLQSEDVAIDDAIKLHGRGIEITKQLEKYLKDAENTVSKVSGVEV